MKIICKICFLVLLLTMGARGEIEKIASVCDAGICFYWWPKLPQVRGWHQDKDGSYQYSVNALAPDGFTFVNAEAVMYAGATYKPRVPELKSLVIFIENDRKAFVESRPGISITEVQAMTTGDGQIMRSFTFLPKSAGDWEQVSYGEEGDYYLVFTLSSHSKASFDKAQSAYRELIGNYKAKM
jgi:hypothetical protein